MLPKFCSFFDIQLDSLQDLSEPQLYEHTLRKPLNPTGISPDDLSLGTIRSQSIKKLHPPFQISFEKEFMKEHQGVLKMHYKNYVEYHDNNKKVDQESEHCSLKKQQNKQKQITAVSLVKNEISELTCEEKQQFIKDLTHEQKLNEFLNIVVRQCDFEMAKSLIRVSHITWNCFVPHQTDLLQIDDLIDMSEGILTTKIKPMIEELFPEMKNRTEEFYESLYSFLKVMCATFLLTITEYFQNPYFEDNKKDGYKRLYPFGYLSGNISDEDDDEWPVTPWGKKVKYEF